MALKVYERKEDAILNEGNRKSNNFYYFRPGKTVFRILGPYSDKGIWFKSFLAYYFKLGDQSMTLISPKDSGGVDPIYEHGAKLYKSGDEGLVEKAKSFRPRRRFLVNAVILSDPAGRALKDGVFVVEIPSKVKEELVNYDTNIDEGYGDITNLLTGRNITVERTGEGLMTRYSVRPHVQPSNLLDLAKESGVDTNTWVVNNLDEASTPAPLEKLQEVLDRVLAQDNSLDINNSTSSEKSTTFLMGMTVDSGSINSNPISIPNLPSPPVQD